MRKSNLIIGILFSTCIYKGQTITPVVYSNQGGYSSLSGGSISWSIGEPVSESYSTPQRIHTMGFQQPELAIVSLIAEQGEDKDILIYPNPVEDILNINLNGLNEGIYKIDLIDNIGKLIHQSQGNVTKEKNTLQLKVNEIASGNYFIRIESTHFSKSVKINKVN